MYELLRINTYIANADVRRVASSTDWIVIYGGKVYIIVIIVVSVIDVGLMTGASTQEVHLALQQIRTWRSYNKSNVTHISYCRHNRRHIDSTATYINNIYTHTSTHTHTNARAHLNGHAALEHTCMGADTGWVGWKYAHPGNDMGGHCPSWIFPLWK